MRAVLPCLVLSLSLSACGASARDLSVNTAATTRADALAQATPRWERAGAVATDYERTALASRGPSVDVVHARGCDPR